MHQIVSNPVDSSRRWWVLAIVVAAQFMFGVLNLFSRGWRRARPRR